MRAEFNQAADRADRAEAQVARIRAFADKLRDNMTGNFIARQIDIILAGTE